MNTSSKQVIMREEVIITQRLLINIVISPKGLNMRSFVWLKRTKERVAKN